jgi:hypothetical protein
MRFFGKRSVSSALGICLAIAWYGGIVLMAAILWVIAVLLFMNQQKLHETLLQAPGLTFKVESDFLTIRLPNTTLKSPRVFTGVMATAAVNLSFALAIIFQLRKIVSTLRAGIVFKEESARRIRRIGFITLAGGAVEGILSGFIGLLVLHDISIPGATVQPSFDVSLETIFIGLVLIVLGEIFRHGARLQAEQDLTV